ncbi:MAG: C4-dicarboxylate ABC transporter substrate-binding protein [Chloroflexota bacterium]
MSTARISRRSILAGAGAGALATVAASVPLPLRALAAGEPRTLRMATSWSGGALMTLGAQALADRVAQDTDGRIRIEVATGGALGPALDVPGTVLSGGAEMGHSWSAYAGIDDPVAVLLGGLPGGLDSVRMLHWLDAGGGRELWTRYRREVSGLVAFPLVVQTPEIFLHARTPVRTEADMAGLRIRTSGSWLTFAAELGAETVAMPQAEILGALADGSVDGAEWATPSQNLELGLPQTVGYTMLPGVHQPGSPFELTIAPATWDSLDSADRAVIERAARDVTLEAWPALGVADRPAMARIAGMTEVVTLAPELLARVRDLVADWSATAAAADAAFAEILAAQTAFAATWDAGASWDAAARG